jgi:integrase
MLVNRLLRALKSIFALAKNDNLIKYNPAEALGRLPEEEKPEKEIFTAQELSRFLGATEPESRERIIFLTMALTGCRVGEILGATWGAMDFKEGLLRVRTNLGDLEPGREPYLKSPKSRSSYREIPLPPELAYELKRWKLKCPPSEKDLVIASDRGKPVRRQIVAMAVRHI